MKKTSLKIHIQVNIQISITVHIIVTLKDIQSMKKNKIVSQLSFVAYFV